MAHITFTLQQLATHIQADFKGNPDYTVQGITTLSKATPDHVSFLSNAHRRQELKTTKAGIVILSRKHLPYCHSHCLVTSNPYLGFAKIAQLFSPNVPLEYGIHSTALIDKSAQIGAKVRIDPYVVIGPRSIIEEGAHIGTGSIIGSDAWVGRDSHFFPHVTLYDGVKIGQRVTVHTGTVIGSDGFGYAKEDTGNGFRWVKIPQQGSVYIGDDVEIGANTTIDCGTLEDTRIEEGVILDNQIQIAHNVTIGAHTALAGCSVVGGSTTIGKFCAIGGKTSIADHLVIADHAMIAGGSNIAHSIEKPGIYGGPFLAHTNWKRNTIAFQNLSKLLSRVRTIEKQLLGNRSPRVRLKV
ncbi:MAG: UDP-3-O-(3-hydroxymyristoyl)glucosamine N-acyltransferase [Gammaproteobacteria bacterium]|nr:UDP-3-O-(3-hydroxymyristoyl)glucosamine N-acyltransferase [Gammaproteobacteria bacterium]